MSDDNIAWIASELNALSLQDEFSEFAPTISEMKERKEIRDFLVDLLGEHAMRNPRVQRFIDDLAERNMASPNQVAYRKEIHNDAGVGGGGKNNKRSKSRKSAKKGPPGPEVKGTNMTQSAGTKKDSIYESLLIGDEERKPKSTKKPPKKTQYIKIVSDNQLSSVLLPGRNQCQCLAQRHGLINNCVECGRIVCEQEGEGSCMFCGALVATPQHTQKILSQSKKGRELERRLRENSKPANFTPLAFLRDATTNYDRAVAHKDKLLEYDRQNIHRSKVLDDEADYFSSTRWLSADERARAEQEAEKRDKAMHESRLHRSVTFDFAGRRIVEDQDNGYTGMQSEMGVIYDRNGGESTSAVGYGDDEEGDGGIIDPEAPFQPIFVSPSSYRASSQVYTTPKTELSSRKSRIRNQDKDMQLLRDEGTCLTLHQPWASLLVHGIKQVEGRNWYSPHRGKLWIHSAGKEASTQEITALQDHYRGVRGHGTVFPRFYPAGVVLGFVYVEDVVRGQDYTGPGAEEENDSEFLFICRDATALAVPIKVSGQHKIWKLPKNIHNTVMSQMV